MDFVVGVLLAAGEGRRLGLGPKAMLPLSGTPQAARMVHELWRGGCDEVVVVLGAGAEDVQRAVGPGAHHVVVNEEWRTGMASSFRAGVDAAVRLAPDRRDAGVLVALADQPDIDGDVVAHLRAAATADRVTAAGFPADDGGLSRGHPVLFPVALAAAAAELAEGDAGGRAWLRRHPDLLTVVDVGHLATGRDIDTPADLHRWREERGADRDTAG